MHFVLEPKQNKKADEIFHFLDVDLLVLIVDVWKAAD